MTLPSSGAVCAAAIGAQRSRSPLRPAHALRVWRAPITPVADYEYATVPSR